VAVVALVAGTGAAQAFVLGLSMTLLQFAIGALNDLVDAPRDAGQRVGKPIPDGVVSPEAARFVIAGSVGGGLLLAAVSGGLGLVLLALLGLAIGAAYDLRAKGTTLSWLPLAAGIPLLPLYGWYGATGDIPAMFLVIVPAAANAGAALAIANALVDVERDEAAGNGSIAVALGRHQAARLVVLLLAVVTVLAIGTTLVTGAPAGWVAAVALAACVPLGGAAFGMVAAGRPGTAWRELAWEVQAVGTGLLAVAWLGALSATSVATPGH